jgi:hypothetical protein
VKATARGEVERDAANFRAAREGDTMNGQIIVFTYLLYLSISVALTVWVAHTLHRNGRIFLVDVFQGHEGLADSVNHLLVVGFYLVNFGYVSLALRLGYDVTTVRESIEALSYKVGLVLVVLGAMHFTNLYVFSRIRRRPRFHDAPWANGRQQEPRVWAKES